MPPNILYIHSHDTGRYVQPDGHAIPTPNIRWLADQRVMFRNAFCAAPPCSAASTATRTIPDTRVDYADVLLDLRERLDQWMVDTGDPLLHGPVAPPVGARVNSQSQRSADEPTQLITEPETAIRG